MNIKESENELFEEWKGDRKGFVKDGIVSEQDYLSSKPKIVFILKEVNDPDGGGLKWYSWDLREFVKEGGRSQTWDNIARWVHGIRNIEFIPDWSFYKEITNEFRIETLKSTCIINLKKSPGTHTTDYSTLNKVANEDKQLIQRQYQLYDPDLTICGGTGDLFKWVAGFEEIEWKTTKRGVWYFERESKKYVVSFAHPEARVQKSLLVYGLFDAISEIYT